MNVTVQLDAGAFMPTKAHATDVGYDLYLKEDVDLIVGEYKLIDTGVHFAIPEGWKGQVRTRSSSHKRYLDVGFSTIDAGYLGSVGIFVRYLPSDYYRSVYSSVLHLKRGERIAQVTFKEVPSVILELGNVTALKSERGAKGYGSSGV